MVDLTPTEIVAVTVIVVLAAIVAGLMLYLIRRLRERRAKLLGELHDRPELVQDRAFNRIAMARRESEILARQGGDVSRARDLIAQAQGAFDTRSYDRAYQLAQQAHEALVHARQASPLRRDEPPAGPTRASPPSAVPVPPAASAGPAASPPATGIPKNRAESQFQLRLLDSDLDAARSARAKAAVVREAARIRNEAGGAFDRGDFTEAFRLALKGRRALGAPVEGLPVTASLGGPGATASAGGGASDATLTAERVASADRCPECGYPALSGDTYCRGCGVPRTPATCAQCGTVRKPTDTFCGRCGTRFA
jgi:hypothetical protein